MLRDAPRRTAFGFAGLVFLATLWLAGSTDIAATQLHLSIEGLARVLRVVLFSGPFIAYWFSYRIFLALKAKDEETATDGTETGITVRTPLGGYDEPRQPVDMYERWRLHEHHEAGLTHAASEDQRGEPVRRRRTRHLHTTRCRTRSSCPSTRTADQGPL